ncbi:MAG: hypothetical protein AB7P00_10895 [Sandaracinaceae bacterium]
MAVGEVVMLVRIGQTLTSVRSVPSLGVIGETVLEGDNLVIREHIAQRLSAFRVEDNDGWPLGNADRIFSELRVFPESVNDEPSLVVRSETRRDLPQVSGNELMRVFFGDIGIDVSPNDISCTREIWAQVTFEETA